MAAERRIERLRDPSEVYRLSSGESPPSIGWALGPDGLFHDGVKLADQAEFQVGRTGESGFCEIRYVPLTPDDPG
jgi:hypothetical protein